MNTSRFRSSFRLVSVEAQQASLSSRLDISGSHEEPRLILPFDVADEMMTAPSVESSPQVLAEVAEDDFMVNPPPPVAEFVRQEADHVNEIMSILCEMENSSGLNDVAHLASNGQGLDISGSHEEPRQIVPTDQDEAEMTGVSSSLLQVFAEVAEGCEIDFLNMLHMPLRPRAEFAHQDNDHANELVTDLGQMENSIVNEEEADSFQDNSGLYGEPRNINNIVYDGTVEETDDVGTRLRYRRKMSRPLAACPPPPQPPGKVRGGRKTLRKITIETELLKAESAIKGDLHAEEAVGKPTYGDERPLTYTGPFDRCILQHKMQTQKLADEAVKLENMCKVNPEASFQDDDQSQPTVYDLVFSQQALLSFKHQLKIEQFCNVLVAYFNATETLRQPTDPIDEVPRIDPVLIQPPGIRQVLTELAARIHTDSQLRHLNHWNLEAVQQPSSVLMDLNENHEALATTLSVSHASALKAGQFLRTFTQELFAVKRAKESLQQELETLKCDLTKRIAADLDPIIAELAVFNAPYFKTPRGIMYTAFTDPLVMPYVLRVDKQKWTVKDLAGLKVAVKRSLIERAVEFVEAKYVELQATCKARAEEEIALAVENNGCLDESVQPVKRRRGRPSKTDVEKRDKYGSISPVLCRLPNGVVVTHRVTPKQIADWRTQKEKRWLNMSYDNVVKELNKQFRIDWDDVCEKLMRKSKKSRSAEDCKLAFNHEIDPFVNSKRLTKEELNQLQEIASNPRFRYNWTNITREMNRLAILNKQPVRTSFFLFTQYKMKISPCPRLEWTPAMDDHLRSLILDFPGDWRRIAIEMNDERITKNEVVERYKRHLNPMQRIGAFTRVEDALLLLTIERLKPFLLAEGHFGCLLAYLPWRYETTWRDRANNLFSDWIVPWTMEEDLKLLEMAVEYKRNWQKISEQFNSFKNRKGCLTRFKILTRHLKDKRFKAFSTRESIELYHEAYAMTRYNVFQYRHLREVLELLVRMRNFNAVEKNKKFLEQHPFVGLESDKEPEEDQLRHMLITFDSDILRSTIKSLRLYMRSRDSYWQKWKQQHGTRKRTFDRRTFHKDSPQSVASAIHIRGLKLKKKEAVKGLPLNEFEEHVYVYFGRFLRTKPLKKDAYRPYLPSPADLITWPKISRIIATSSKEVAGFSGPCNNKWQRKGMAKKKKISQSRGVGGKANCDGRKLKRPKRDDLISSGEDEELPEHLDVDEEVDKSETVDVDNHSVLADMDGDRDLHDERDIHSAKDQVQTPRRNPARAARQKNNVT